ncbi:phosphate ABC transporter permease subunit PstC [Bacteriovorax sp. Seq25_V]|uniref:phosphate ABC transporter permease subunit PstC n=1 Tax=Bacteriovorax sp. Seq25_V TaxID=1201288 RepID=UPI00038A4C05|nr:phosphate ABC transporter permease subunit PstC [Bacteriovorax sp. Seq25_V]EQC45387.1 phosphate ABC transporter, permease protein PstC [Bacteriovorax sp. Seq25_V]
MIEKSTVNIKDGPSSSWAISFSKQDKLAYLILRFIALIIVILLGAMIFKLFIASKLAFNEFGFSFIYTDFWNPIEDEFGALPFIFGTIITSVVALIIAAPISIGVAIYVNEYLGTKVATFLSLFVELIAAVPSIIFGLWGLYYLAPFIKNTLAPFLKSTLGFLPLFQGVSYGIGILAASIILALMIIPTITSVCREIFKTIPNLNKEAALALGATKFEMISLTILKPSFSGIIGAIVLGLGRALGETMAVAMVIGNTPIISSSLFSSASTMASVMANEYAEADSDLHLSALCYIGLLLFVVTFIVNLFARTIVWRQTKKSKRRN